MPPVPLVPVGQLRAVHGGRRLHPEHGVLLRQGQVRPGRVAEEVQAPRHHLRGPQRVARQQQPGGHLAHHDLLVHGTAASLRCLLAEEAHAHPRGAAHGREGGQGRGGLPVRVRRALHPVALRRPPGQIPHEECALRAPQVHAHARHGHHAAQHHGHVDGRLLLYRGGQCDGGPPPLAGGVQLCDSLPPVRAPLRVQLPMDGLQPRAPGALGGAEGAHGAPPYGPGPLPEVLYVL
mmetsp:Transcript_72451/g.228386  ORF Transcript_72451/g.228386 Transcript_72451/m.228386 type:complete len:235 (+) Transcript_72451:306-1010(+)